MEQEIIMSAVSRVSPLLLWSALVLCGAGCDRSTPESTERSRLLEGDIADDRSDSARREPTAEPNVTEGVVSNPDLRDVPASWGEPHVLRLEPTGPNGEFRPSENPPEASALLSPPDAGSGVPGAPSAPGDVLPDLGPPPSPAEEDLDQMLSAPPAEATGPPCEHSFNILRDVARRANRAVPLRSEYLAACEALPSMMQRCIDPGFRQDHEEECTTVRDRTNPQLLERFRRVVEGEGGD